MGGKGVAGPARRGSGPARAGVRGHGGAVRGGKRCLKRVSQRGRGGLPGTPPGRERGLGSRHIGLREGREGSPGRGGGRDPPGLGAPGRGAGARGVMTGGERGELGASLGAQRWAPGPGRDEHAPWRLLGAPGPCGLGGLKCARAGVVLLYGPNSEHSAPGRVTEAGAAARASEGGLLPRGRTVSGPGSSSNGKAGPKGREPGSPGGWSGQEWPLGGVTLEGSQLCKGKPGQRDHRVPRP